MKMTERWKTCIRAWRNMLVTLLRLTKRVQEGLDARIQCIQPR